MSLPLACALCAALLAVDLLARSLRLHWFLRGAGYRLPVRSLCASILFGDAAAAVTPMRLGGEPARWLGLLSGGVPARVSAAVLALEMVSYLTVVAVSGAAAAWLLGAGWWADVGRGWPPVRARGCRGWSPSSRRAWACGCGSAAAAHAARRPPGPRRQWSRCAARWGGRWR